jgi:uncharacterized membrane protein (UPF0127 family)
MPIERCRWMKWHSCSGRVRSLSLKRTPNNGTRPMPWDDMASRTYCVYNQTRESFLSLGVTEADTIFTRLKGLIGRLNMRSDEGLWVIPSSGVHTWGVLFPLDLIYLDQEHRVVFVTEHFQRFRIGPLRLQAASVLELPTHTIYSSQTQAGDQLVICMADEIEERLLQRVPTVVLKKGGGRT